MSDGSSTGAAPLRGDTDPRVRVVLVERLRELSVAARAELVGSSFRAGEELLRAGVRLRYPAAPEEEVRLRAAALRLGDDLARRALGWDADEKGR